MSEALEAQSRRFLIVAEELDKAAAHARVAAAHFKSGEVPRGCAHAFAAEGHLVTAKESLKQAAKEQAARSKA